MMVHKKKKIHCRKNSQSRLNPVSFSVDTNKFFTVFLQNIRGLRNRNNELLRSMLPKLPHIVCLTQHQLKEQEIGNLSMNHYILVCKFCRQNLKHGSTGIFVHEYLAFTNTVQEFCMWQDTELCMVKINLLTAMIYVICVYRLPTGNFICFIQGADIFLNKLNTKY